MMKTGLKTMIAAAAIVTFIYSWDTNMMQPVLPFFLQQPDTVAKYGMEPKMVGMIIGSAMGVYALINCTGNMLFGWLADVWGRKIPITIGFLGCAIALMFYQPAPDVQSLLIVRGIHGFFSGALAPCSSAILADLAPPQRRGGFMAMWAIFVSAGTIIASPLAGSIQANPALGPQTVWLMMAIAYVAVVAVIWIMIGDTRKISSVNSDAAGIVEVSRTKPRFIDVVSKWNVWVACIGILSLFWVMSAWVTVLSQHLNNLSKNGILGANPGMTFGIFMALMGLAVVILGYQFGRLTDSIGRRIPLVIAFVLLIASVFMVATRIIPVMVFGWIAGYCVAAALIWPSVMGLITNDLAPDERGIGMGFFMVFPTLAIAIGSPVMGIISDRWDVENALRFGAIMPLVALVMSAFLKKRTASQPMGKKTKILMWVAIGILIVLSVPLTMMLQAKPA
jgi:MFS family permease